MKQIRWGENLGALVRSMAITLPRAGFEPSLNRPDVFTMAAGFNKVDFRKNRVKVRKPSQEIVQRAH